MAKRDGTRPPLPFHPWTFLVVALAAFSAAGRAGDAKDPLASEIDRWTAFVRDSTSTDPLWAQLKPGSEQGLARAAEALRSGRRFLALQRLAPVRANLQAITYVFERPAAQRKEPALFEAEWARMGKVLERDMKPPSPAALDGVTPAAVRAVGETALPQVRIYYDASLDYGRSTDPDSGLFYLGDAQASRELVAFTRTLSAPTALRAPRLRALDPELDALEAEMLAVYKPPVSIDRHGEFIGASAALKEARELNAAGLRHGALLRYLQAALRFAPMRQPAPALEADALAKSLSELEARLARGGVDQSIGRIFLESAQGDLSSASSAAGTGNAAAIVSDVLPRYFAALEPARPAPPKPEPRATVTLVRWPYT